MPQKTTNTIKNTLKSEKKVQKKKFTILVGVTRMQGEIHAISIEVLDFYNIN